MSNTLFNLQGKTYLVTGASSGIGYELCKTISLMNGRFIAVGRKENLLQQLIAECTTVGNSYFVADLTKSDDIDKLITTIDKVDGVVHSAGIVKLALLKFYKQELMDEIRLVNYDAIVLIMHGLLKAKKLNKGSSSVLVSSIAGLFGQKGNGIYSGMKGALIGISKVWANELAHTKSRMNVVSPGMVRTGITLAMIDSLSKEVVDEDEAKYPLGYGNVEDVAYPVVFLLSDASKWITGQNIILDGGRTSWL